MKVTDLHNLNTEYNYLINFIGLGEVYNEIGLTEYTNDELEKLECMLHFHLENSDQKKLANLMKQTKELIEVAMANMERKAKNQLIKL